MLFELVCMYIRLHQLHHPVGLQTYILRPRVHPLRSYPSSWRPRTWSLNSVKMHRIFHQDSRTAPALLVANNQEGTNISPHSEGHFTTRRHRYDLVSIRTASHLRHHLHGWTPPTKCGWTLHLVNNSHRHHQPRHNSLYDPTIQTPPRPTWTPRSPPSSSSPPGSTSVQHGYVGRPIDIPPDVDFHDTNKVNGLDFPSKIRQSRFTSYKDIEGMDPLQVPLWKFLYRGIHNTWLRRIAYGRETFVIPFDNIGTTVFIAELVAQLRSRNVDLDKLATYKSRSAGQFVNQKEATQNMAKEVAQLLQSWLPAHPPADHASQQRILELEAELAKMKSENANPPPNTSEPSHPASSPIGRAFHGQTASTSFDPATLLVSPGSVNPWLVANQPSSLTETQYKKWLKDLKLPQHQLDTLNKQIEKIKEWWQNQPDDAVQTIQRASVAMGIDPGKHKNSTSDEIVLRVMTVAMMMHSWLAAYLNSSGSKVARILSDLAVAHACILTLAFVTPNRLAKTKICLIPIL